MQKIILGLLVIWSSAQGAPLQVEEQRPNIVIIMGDDLTFSDIEPYGSKQVRTPNLTRLAKEGMCLDNMFTTTAMCAPTRQQFMTGLFPIRNGAWPNHSRVYDGTKSIAHYIKDLGYRAALLGKRHINPLASFPFEYLGGRDDDHGKGMDINLNLAERFIHNAGDSPFLLMITSNQPHVPWNRGDAAKYPPDAIQLRPGCEDTPMTRQTLSRYFAEITYLDSLVGKSLEIIERAGITKNTLVIFTSEHGSQFPFEKWTCYDHGLKTAFIAKWPGMIEAGSRASGMIQYVDVVPTLIEIAGGNPAKINTGTKDSNGYEGFDGKSFLPILKGEKRGFRDFVYGVHTTRGIINGSEAYGIRSIRSNKYLYIRNLNAEATFSNVLTDGAIIKEWIDKNPKGRVAFYQKRPEEELYDIVKDPEQLVNLADKKEYNSIKEKLKVELDAFMEQQGDHGKATEMQATERLVRSGHD